MNKLEMNILKVVLVGLNGQVALSEKDYKHLCACVQTYANIYKCVLLLVLFNNILMPKNTNTMSFFNL